MRLFLVFPYPRTPSSSEPRACFMDINCKNFTRVLRRPSEPAALTGHLFQLGKARSLIVVFPMPMAVASAKEPPIAGRTAIRILEHHEVPEPVLDATSSRPEALFAAAIRTARGLSARSGLLHGESFGAGIYVTTSGRSRRSGSGGQRITVFPDCQNGRNFCRLSRTGLLPFQQRHFQVPCFV